MNVNEGMPKTIEKEREEYIVKKLKEMLEDAFYTKLTERPEVEKIEGIEKLESVEEFLEALRGVAPELGKEINLWYEIGRLANMTQVKDFFRKQGIDIDLEKTIAEIGEEFDGAWKNVNPPKTD